MAVEDATIESRTGHRLEMNDGIRLNAISDTQGVERDRIIAEVSDLDKFVTRRPGICDLRPEDHGRVSDRQSERLDAGKEP